nr:FCD domain-containing protein [Nakamurella antarctica]
MGSALRWHLASRHLPVGDIVGARVLIESWAVKEASVLVHAEPALLAPARALLAAMDDSALAPEAFLALDAAFHVMLAELAGNTVITAVMTAMREGIQAYVTAAVAAYPDWSSMVARLRAEHHAVVAAMALGEGDEAAGEVRRHIAGFYAETGVSY